MYQDVYALGFPLGSEINVKLQGHHEMSAFAKKAIISNLGEGDQIYIDTRLNEGFSGGPIIFVNSQREMSIAGVISSYSTKLDGFSSFYQIKLATMAMDDLIEELMALR